MFCRPESSFNSCIIVEGISGEAMISYLVLLLGVTVNKASIPSNCKRAIVVPIYIGDDRSLVTDYRPASLNSVVCEQTEHVLASYLRQG